MRVIIDTNIYISALLTPNGKAAQLISKDLRQRYTLLWCEELLSELRAVTKYSKVKTRVSRHDIGALINLIRRIGDDTGPLPHVERSADPYDNFLLAMAEAGKADVLITGDKSGLLDLGEHGDTKILTLGQFLGQFLEAMR